MYNCFNLKVPLSFSSMFTPSIDVPNSITYLNQTPIFEWYVVRCGTKNGYQKDVFERVRLGAQNLITILGSQINIIRGPVWTFNEDGNFQCNSE